MQELGELAPRHVQPATLQILKQIWKNKQMPPRVQTFGWRFLRRAIPTGARAGKYSSHISKLCARCSIEEDDIHLFFTCPFSKAAWFSAPWFIRSEYITANCSSLTQIILNLLNMNHPYASLSNILNFMWCIWKSRNDNLFNRKAGAPYQVHQMAQAIKNNMEMLNSPRAPSQVQLQPRDTSLQDLSCEMQLSDYAHRTTVDILPDHGDTLKSDLLIPGTKIYSDATWKTKKAPGRADITSSGIGIFCQIQESNFKATVSIQASAPMTPSVLQAEAEALLLAARIASTFQLQDITFLKDNSTLAKAAAVRSVSHSQVPWEIRNHIAGYINLTQSLGASVYHIKRDLNGVAHDSAHQAIRQDASIPIFRCISSAHRNVSCPILSVVQQMQFQDVVIHAVNCI
jgi:hypothetical protein